MAVFEKYANYYDLFYKGKDTESECDFITQSIQKYGLGTVQEILDAGCGTGRHAITLARHGYSVVGLDLSEHMLTHALENAEAHNVSIPFHKGDIRMFTLSRRFDCVVSLFAVLGYLTGNDDVVKAFTNINHHLKLDGLFIFDVWNGLAVLYEKPEARIRTFDFNGDLIVRTVSPELDAVHHVCHNHYHLCRMPKNGKSQLIMETHTIRFYFPQEIVHYLESTGFIVELLCAYPETDLPADQRSWSMAVVARKVHEVDA